MVQASPLDWCIVRPPAVYGPGDKETLDLFKMARGGLIYMPPKGRLSLIHVDDLARLLIGLTDADAPAGLVIEPDDGKVGGWTHIEFGEALGFAVGRPARTIPMPRFLLSIASMLDGLVRRGNAKLTADRVAYFCHSDWTVDPSLAAPSTVWKPAIETRAGLKATAEWYSEHRWL